MSEIKLTKRGQAVANQKADSNKQWYERYFSQEYYENKEFIENFINDIAENTDETSDLFNFEISTIKKDISTQCSIRMKMWYAQKYALQLQQELSDELPQVA